MAFHHIPCGECYYCRHKVFAQCPVYKRVGTTAGFEPSGGGFSEYVRVMDWIVQHGVVRIPDEVSFEQASFVEPAGARTTSTVAPVEELPEWFFALFAQPPRVVSLQDVQVVGDLDLELGEALVETI